MQLRKAETSKELQPCNRPGPLHVPPAGAAAPLLPPFFLASAKSASLSAMKAIEAPTLARSPSFTTMAPRIPSLKLSTSISARRANRVRRDQHDPVCCCWVLFGCCGPAANHLPALSDSTTTMGSPLDTCANVGVSQQAALSAWEGTMM